MSGSIAAENRGDELRVERDAGEIDGRDDAGIEGRSCLYLKRMADREWR